MRCLGLLVLLWAMPTFAASPVDVYQFENESQRDRYRVLIEELRCPKCLNTNIAGSDAPIAQDLRALVHRMVVQEGKSDAEILAFLQERYGDFVLYDPPFAPRTWLLWLLPVAVAVVLLVVLLRLQRRARVLPKAELDAGDQQRLQDILQDRPS
ncbi:MAG: cytochrome c-type biogenesis protein [Pseudomonadota bacterium]